MQRITPKQAFASSTVSEVFSTIGVLRGPDFLRLTRFISDLNFPLNAYRAFADTVVMKSYKDAKLSALVLSSLMLLASCSGSQLSSKPRAPASVGSAGCSFEGQELKKGEYVNYGELGLVDTVVSCENGKVKIQNEQGGPVDSSHERIIDASSILAVTDNSSFPNECMAIDTHLAEFSKKKVFDSTSNEDLEKCARKGLAACGVYKTLLRTPVSAGERVSDAIDVYRMCRGMGAQSRDCAGIARDEAVEDEGTAYVEPRAVGYKVKQEVVEKYLAAHPDACAFWSFCAKSKYDNAEAALQILKCR